MKENIEFRQIRDFEGIISATLLFIKQNFKALLKVFFSLCSIFILGSILSGIFLQWHILESSSGYAGGNSLGSIFGWRYWVGMLFSLLNYTAMGVSILSFVSLYVIKGNVAPTLEEVWSYFKYYFFRVFWSGMLIYVLWIICTMLCLIPGIYVTPAFSIFFAVMVLENADFGTTFSRSFALVKQNWWLTFATLLVIGIITTVCMSIIYAPSYLLMMINTFSAADLKVLKGYHVFTSISLSISQVFAIIPLVAIAFIYFSLVERKESQGLMSRIEEFGNTQAPVSHPEEDY